MKREAIFKTYHQDQLILLPPSLEELIPKSHPVRVVNSILDRIDITELQKGYKGGGTSSYDPRMLVKVLIYAYLRNIYSSRKIEQALKENIHFMWLSGNSTPDHGTINFFRGRRLKNKLKVIFNQVVFFLAQEGVLSLKEIYIDGTKLEANANRYTFVWGKSIATRKEKIKQQLEQLWAYVEKVYQGEEQALNKPDFTEISPEKVSQAVNTINEALKGKTIDKKVKQKLGYAKKNWKPNLEKYQRQQQILGERNSYSKTDHDATFMRMKEDHMQNGQLKPAYNIQAGTNNQYITNYTVGQTTNDTNTLEEHLEEFNNSYSQYPETATADAGYGSEENYEYLQDKDITPYVKYNYFHKEQGKKHRENAFLPDNLYYNQNTDIYYCPMGQAMKNIGSYTKKTKNGFEQTITKYQAKNCKGCPLRGLCHKSKYNRIIEINHNLKKHKDSVRELLHSDIGVKHRKQRCWDVEAVFGNIKYNKNYRRFMLRTLPKVNIEVGLLALAHNLAKFAA